MEATANNSKKKTSLKTRVQRLGSALSNMVLPNIGAFIAWGLMTALFIPTGWLPNADLAKIGTPMVTYLLPLLIAYSGGKAIAGHRGGVVGAIATMGVIVGANIPMFIGAMALGPLGGWCIKKWDDKVQPHIRQGFEMLVNNFSAGIIGMILAIIGFYAIGPVVSTVSGWLATGVDYIISIHLIPLANIFIEPAKILFLNNAINQGILTPLGIQAAAKAGKSILFLLEPNPGPGLGVLLAFALFGKGNAKSSAPGAIIIQFLGGIHEIYFPYILMKPMLFLSVIAGGVTGTFTFNMLGAGLKASPSPGSIISILLMTPKGLGNFVSVLLGVTAAAVVSFLISMVILRRDKTPEVSLEDSQAQLQSMKSDAKGTSTKDAKAILAGGEVNKIIFACDAGMGSSAMGASILRDKVKKAGLDQSVTNTAISNLKDEPGLLVVTQEELADRALKQTPNAVHVAVENFLNSPKYDEIITSLKTKDVTTTEQPAAAKAQTTDGTTDYAVDFSQVEEVNFVHHDQNVGSATMAMATFRSALRKAGKEITVRNVAVNELNDRPQVLVLASKETAKRIKSQFGDLQIIVVANLLDDAEYAKIISKLK
ncbi:PTS mannitol transporter subunit IICBA [Loigolactobacillus coryniformis]|uniref:PTS system mannitol-specific EIICB component n=1 Tax=Loigolactobacillus coryniformis TaxID=1610 RepID=A0A5B8TPG7_9LACO|nr:PTS mannitol transporter subunit IICBA [Loigolactobacillus coryniformis]QEA54369.1 PTS mannitol transporter subunit IICBA [Loigolactobacillus coryniformis]